jgi:DNA-binding CsgD family transcriptional regulator
VPPTRRLADRIAGSAAAAFVGRATERERLTTLLTAEPGPAVVFLHGPGGIGKSALLAATLDRLAVTDVRIDGRHIEPTYAGVLGAIGADLDLDPGDTTSVAGIAAAFADLEVQVLALDGYEHLGVIDGWLRNELLPALPAAVRIVLAGRNPPNVAWRTSPGWRRLVGQEALGPLTESDAAELVAGHGLTPELAGKALRFGRGHPLALELAAEAYGRRPGLHLHEGPSPEVVEELVDVLYDGLDPDARRIAEAASILRRVTEPLLGAVLARDDVADAWRTLRDLPFTSVTPYGLEISPVVQDVTATALELRNPHLTRELRRRAARAALADVARSPGWEPTADLLHLVQQPVIRNAFVPPAGFQHPVERATPTDRDAILAIAARFGGPIGEGLVARWWRAHAADVAVHRGPLGEVSAYGIVVELDRIDPSLEDDPVVARTCADLTRRPLPPGGRGLLNRQALSARRGPDLSPDLAPLLVDITRTYLAMRPRLGRVYVAQQGSTHLVAMMSALGFVAVGEPFEIGAVPFVLAALEFGPGSVDGWLARHVEAETAPAPPPGVAAPAVSTLSPRELAVLAALADGLTNHGLAERLFISERTANRHLSNIFTKLGVHNRTAAARIAVEAGLAG